MVNQTRTVTLGPLQYAIIVLTIATALIHISLLFPDTLFILNGLGYLALLAALYLPIPQLAEYRGLIRWIFIAYTAVTILAWVAIGEKTGALEFVTKGIEVVLIVLLFVESRQQA